MTGPRRRRGPNSAGVSETQAARPVSRHFHLSSQGPERPLNTAVQKKPRVRRAGALEAPMLLT